MVFDIDASTANPAPGGAPYSSFREAVTLVANVANIEDRPFTLPRIAVESLAQIVPTQSAVVTNGTLGISLSVAAGAARNMDGSQFVGQLSISPVPRGLAPAVMPAFLDPNQLITVQPVGVVFDPPALISFPNNRGLPPGGELDIWSLDPERGEFVIVATGRVSSNGARINRNGPANLDSAVSEIFLGFQAAPELAA